MIKLITFITLLSTSAYSQNPTVVYGASELPDKTHDSVVLVQPENAQNPLGNPIVAPENVYNTESLAVEQVSSENNDLQQSDKSVSIQQTSEQNPPAFSETPQELKNKIENTLYQGGDRIYDIQSYPINDIKEITEPNIQPTITTYPEY
jgi:hypothetical protein